MNVSVTKQSCSPYLSGDSRPYIGSMHDRVATNKHYGTCFLSQLLHSTSCSERSAQKWLQRADPKRTCRHAVREAALASSATQHCGTALLSISDYLGRQLRLMATGVSSRVQSHFCMLHWSRRCCAVVVASEIRRQKLPAGKTTQLRSRGVPLAHGAEVGFGLHMHGKR